MNGDINSRGTFIFLESEQAVGDCLLRKHSFSGDYFIRGLVTGRKQLVRQTPNLNLYKHPP